MVLIVCSISPKTWLTALSIFLRFSIIAPLRETEGDFGEDEDNSAPSESDEEASQLFCK